MSTRRLITVPLVLLGLTLGLRDGAAFPHIVGQGETLAQIAERMYGKVELERVIVAANGLDDTRGTSLVPGMRLELPAVSYRKVLPGEGWPSIAAEVLGGAERGDVLAQLNGSKPWLPPEVGREIVIPYSLRWVAAGGDTIQTVAYRFLGNRDRAWLVASYNHIERANLRQGEVLLIPLVDLDLTEEGKQAARLSDALVRGEGGGAALEHQRRGEQLIPQLAQDLRRGMWVEAVALGSALLAREGLSEPQLAEVYRYLTEAYVALDAAALAADSCIRWRKHDPAAVLDPIEQSPKILAVCVGEAPHGAAPGGVYAGDDAGAPP